MQAKLVSGSLVEPEASGWGSAALEQIDLAAVPIAGQPSSYIRTAWADRSYGLVRDLSVQAAHDGEKLFLRIEWVSPTRQAANSNGKAAANPIEGPDAFPDALAVMAPVNGDARLESMGSDKEPVSVWRWSADNTDRVEELTATGIGSITACGSTRGLSVKASEDGDSWQLVLSTPFEGSPGLSPGGTVKVAFAVWAGVNQERGGIKSATREWIELRLGE